MVEARVREREREDVAGKCTGVEAAKAVPTENIGIRRETCPEPQTRALYYYYY